ncbi:hypothetical protein [Cysteiniphilum sp. QT6929]|uniref:hypothetical protein n=1 Tax=Cysteiniphilum sp. QT6929 TaxID=2975055 RepID=UPI0024B3913E|nr:hypothetical protein [Cysteiniphilum sp. QT6929]WHN65738.1 hypothetical protein NYP54_00520 [Cysteiniphilum sp. QT6929]
MRINFPLFFKGCFALATLAISIAALYLSYTSYQLSQTNLRYEYPVDLNIVQSKAYSWIQEPNTKAFILDIKNNGKSAAIDFHASLITSQGIKIPLPSYMSKPPLTPTFTINAGKKTVYPLARLSDIETTLRLPKDSVICGFFFKADKIPHRGKKVHLDLQYSYRNLVDDVKLTNVGLVLVYTRNFEGCNNAPA